MGAYDGNHGIMDNIIDIHAVVFVTQGFLPGGFDEIWLS